MFKKLKIDSQNQINQLTKEVRASYYLHRDLYNTKSEYTHNSEKLVTIKPSPKINVEPFWEDSQLEIEDKQLQQILDLEGRLMAQYIEQNPNFGVKVRESVYLKLKEVANNLPNNYMLIIKIGFRPVSVQYQLFNEVFAYFKTVNPHFDDNPIKAMTLEFVTHPDSNIPPHSTGAAIDMTLFDSDKNDYIDMGSAINYPDNRSWTFNFDNLSQEQIDNRMLLTDIMLEAGFANLASEWWHFSYGDPRWAVFYDTKSMYGLSE